MSVPRLFDAVKVSSEIKDQLDRIRWQLMTKNPHWFGLSGCLSISFTDHPLVDTACTDGWWVYFSPKFWEAKSEPERLFVWCHEICHIAMKHPQRTGNRDQQIFNMACDYVINAMLVKEGLEAPDDALLDSRFDGMDEYEVYSILLKEQPKKPPGGGGKGPGGKKPGGEPGNDPGGGGKDPGSGSGQGDDDGDDPHGVGNTQYPGGVGGFVNRQDVDQQQIQERQQEVQRALEDAERIAKARGLGAGGLSQIADTVAEQNAEVDAWIRRFISQTEPSGVSWKRVDRRMQAYGIQWPGPEMEGLEKLLFAIDTSGSMSSEEIERVGGIVAGALGTSTYQEMLVAYFHTSVWGGLDELRNGQKFTCRKKLERGGTDFDDVMRIAEEEGVKAIIILTDGWCPAPEDPGIPVLWVETTSHSYDRPYGEVVELV